MHIGKYLADVLWFFWGGNMRRYEKGRGGKGASDQKRNKRKISKKNGSKKEIYVLGEKIKAYMVGEE
jgi:hypothetical protein